MKKFLLSLCLCLIAIPAFSAPTYTTNHYESVNLGDHYSQVTAVLGAPTEINYQTEYEVSYIWEGDGGTVITVTLHDDFVIGKWEVGVEPPFHAL
jgi:hypothetical protein